MRNRAGVRGVVVVGRDGLVIEANVDATLSADALAANLPALMSSDSEMGTAANAGAADSMVLLHKQLLIIAAPVTEDANILVVVARGSQFGDLLFEVTRDRSQLAALL